MLKAFANSHLRLMQNKVKEVKLPTYKLQFNIHHIFGTFELDCVNELTRLWLTNNCHYWHLQPQINRIIQGCLGETPPRQLWE